MYRDINNACEECVPEKPVTVVQVRDHVAKQHIIGLLSTEEDAKT